MIPGANTSITTYRLANSGAVQQYGATPILSGVEAYIESESASVDAVLGIEPGLETFTCHIDPADVKVGDQVVDAAGTEYRIKGIERHESGPDIEGVYKLVLVRKVPLHA